ncbi:hypothetical protein AB1Y20_011173 [Prymnesium parvum]|uniref:Uncharacterized protein n=1 Tax=Prymnesium parvum TaxID=97485 RepID=A0AB34IPM6_PRYPA
MLSPSALLSAAALGCVVWVDRHVHKNGGTSVRDIMLRTSRDGRFWKLGAWDELPYKSTWRHVFATLAALEEPCDASVQQTRVGVEVHERVREFDGVWLPNLRRVRQAVHRPCCRVLLSTRIREPLSHYLSAFYWVQAAKGVFRRPNMSVPTFFEKWMPPNLQSTLLLQGTFHGWYGGSYYFKSKARYQLYQMNESKFEHLVDTLTHDYDVVYPVERFEEGLWRIAELLALPELVAGNRSSIHLRPSVGRRLDEDNSPRFLRACPNISHCRMLVEQRAPYDLRLYRLLMEGRFKKTDLVASDPLPSRLPGQRHAPCTLGPTLKVRGIRVAAHNSSYRGGGPPSFAPEAEDLRDSLEKIGSLCYRLLPRSDDSTGCRGVACTPQPALRRPAPHLEAVQHRASNQSIVAQRSASSMLPSLSKLERAISGMLAPLGHDPSRLSDEDRAVYEKLCALRRAVLSKEFDL